MKIHLQDKNKYEGLIVKTLLLMIFDSVFHSEV